MSLGTPESDKGGIVICKDGKEYPVTVKKETRKKEEELLEKAASRTSLDVLRDMSKLYLELPRESVDMIAAMFEGGECLTAGRGERIAWWFGTYAKHIKDYTEVEDIMINVPD